MTKETDWLQLTDTHLIKISKSGNFIITHSSGRLTLKPDVATKIAQFILTKKIKNV